MHNTYQYIIKHRSQEMIRKENCLDHQTNSPNWYYKKCMETTKENLYVDKIWITFYFGFNV